MKKIITLCCLIACYTSTFAQRESDLKVSITSPINGATVEPMEIFSLNVFLTNFGSAHIEMDDTLRYSMTIQGQPVIFPDHNDYLIYQQSVGSGGSYTIVRNFVFDSSFDGQIVDVCITVVPMNGSDPISDPELGDNSPTITLHVGATAGLGETAHHPIVVAPNPANNSFGLVSTEHVSSVSVRDAMGKEAAFYTSGFDALDCSMLQSGTYFLVINAESGRTVERLVINR